MSECNRGAKGRVLAAIVLFFCLGMKGMNSRAGVPQQISLSYDAEVMPAEGSSFVCLLKTRKVRPAKIVQWSVSLTPHTTYVMSGRTATGFVDTGADSGVQFHIGLKRRETAEKLWWKQFNRVTQGFQPWVNEEITFSTGDGDLLRIYVESWGIGQFYVDGLRLVREGEDKNLIPNGGFEHGLRDWSVYKDLDEKCGASVYVLPRTNLLANGSFEEDGKSAWKGHGSPTKDRAYTGTQSLVLAKDGGAAQTAETAPGQSYTVACYARTGYLAEGGYASLTADFGTRGQIEIGRLYGFTDWTVLKKSFSSDQISDTCTVRLKLDTGTTACDRGTVYFDDVTLCPSRSFPAVPPVVKVEERPVKIIVPDISVPPLDMKRLKKEYPASAFDVSIKDGLFHRGGKPVFLLGQEYLDIPWVQRFLDMDFVVATLMQYGPRVEHRYTDRERVIEVKQFTTFENEPHYFFHKLHKMKEMIRSGNLLIVAPGEKSILERWGKDGAVKEPFPMLTVRYGHYFRWCHEHPMGRKMRRERWKALIASLRDVPIFGWEMFNEVQFMDDCPASMKMFRERMEAKYGTIENANKTWDAEFTGFDKIWSPMDMVDKYLYRDWGWGRGNPVKRPYSGMLWLDWRRFNEKHFAGILRDCYRDAKPLLPGTYVTCQSYAGIHHDFKHGDLPRMIAEAQDFYGQEASTGIYYKFKPGEENYGQIKLMLLMGPFHNDVVRSVTEKKPVVNLETNLSAPVPRAILKVSDGHVLTVSNDRIHVDGEVVELHGMCRFRLDPAKEGTKSGWWKKDLDDSAWNMIGVPGKWEDQQSAWLNYDGDAWYRMRCVVPAHSKGKKLYLSGERLDDKAWIYLNGKLIYVTKSYDQQFDVDITDDVLYGQQNILALRVYDIHEAGGILRYLSIVDAPKPRWTKIPVINRISKGQMRLALWSQLLHGLDGTVLPYLYHTEHSAGSEGISKIKKATREALKAIPRWKKEVASVSEVVMPKPRIRGKIGIVFPYDTLRYYEHLTPKITSMGKNKACLSTILDYYTAARFTQIPVDVTSLDLLVRGSHARYKAIMLPLCKFVSPEAVACLKSYVRNGGVLFVSFGSMSRDAAFGHELDQEEFFGVRVGEAILEGRHVQFDDPRIGKGLAGPRESDKETGRHIIPTTARVLASYVKDGGPAVTVNRFGNGKVYYIGANIGTRLLYGFVRSTMRQERIYPDLEVVRTDGQDMHFVESYLLGQKGRYVAYVTNWEGEGGQVRLNLRSLPQGSYRIRDVQRNSVLGPESWSWEDISKGVTIRLDVQDPEILLIEDTSGEPATICDVSDRHKEIEKKIWKATRPGKTRVLWYGGDMVYCPTAPVLLEQFGFEVNLLCSPTLTKIETHSHKGITTEDLGSYDAIIVASHQNFRLEQDLLNGFAENGGGVLIGKNVHGRDCFFDQQNNIRGEASYPVFTNMTDHVMAHGVRRFVTNGAVPVSWFREHPVVRGNKGSVYSEARKNGFNMPVLQGRTRGKGRIVWVGSERWLRPELLAAGDNAQLLLNIMRWLTRQDVQVEDKTKLQEIVDVELD